MKICKMFDTRDRRALDIREALNVGTTLTTRLWLSFFSISLGFQLWLGHPSMFSHTGYQVFFRLVPSSYWVGALLLSGSLLLWRVLTPRSRPLWGWLSNGFCVGVWAFLVISRVSVMGSEALLSSSTVVLMMAAWCLLRTEATYRDKETA